MDVICLSDSDDDDAGPPPPSVVPGCSPSPSNVKTDGERRADDAVGARPAVVIDDSDDELDGDTSDSDLELATSFLARPRPAKTARVDAETARVDSPGASAARAASTAREKAETREREKAERAAARARVKAQKAADKEDERQRKQREREEAQLASGKHKARQITVVIDERLEREPLGRSLTDLLTLGVPDGKGRSPTPMLHTFERLPLERSITWVYHDPSDVPVASSSSGASNSRSAMYTMLHLTGAAFAEMVSVDAAASRRLGCAAGAAEWAGAATAPAGGLRRLIKNARDRIPGHTLSILVEGLSAACTLRERREFRTDGVNGFHAGPVHAAMARLAVATPGVRVTSVPDFPAACEHVILVASALAKRPYEREVGVLDILGHKAAKGTMAGAALEAAAAAGSTGVGLGVDGVMPASQSQSQSQSQCGGAWDSQPASSLGGGGSLPESQASVGGEGARGRRRVKSQGEVWASALMKIERCAEADALAIVRAYPTMTGLMARYADPSLTVQRKKSLLADLERVVTSHSGQQGRRLGPVLSERVYEVFRPRGPDDPGDEIVGHDLI